MRLRSFGLLLLFQWQKFSPVLGFAPLGWQQGLIAIVVGHFIGGSMFSVLVTSAQNQKSAMQTVQISFGEKGSALFSLLNAMQLMGWTAVMIYMGADVISILNQTPDASLFPFLTLGLGILISTLATTRLY